MRTSRPTLGTAVLAAALLAAAPAASFAAVTNPAKNPYPVTVKVDGQTYRDGEDTLPGYDDTLCTPIPGVEYDFAQNQILYYDEDGDLKATAKWTEWSRISSYETWLKQQKGSGSSATTPSASSPSSSSSGSSAPAASAPAATSTTSAPAASAPASSAPAATTRSSGAATTKSSSGKASGSSRTTSSTRRASTTTTAAPAATAAVAGADTGKRGKNRKNAKGEDAPVVAGAAAGAGDGDGRGGPDAPGVVAVAEAPVAGTPESGVAGPPAPVLETVAATAAPASVAPAVRTVASADPGSTRAAGLTLLAVLALSGAGLVALKSLRRQTQRLTAGSATA